SSLLPTPLDAGMASKAAFRCSAGGRRKFVVARAVSEINKQPVDQRGRRKVHIRKCLGTSIVRGTQRIAEVRRSLRILNNFSSSEQICILRTGLRARFWCYHDALELLQDRAWDPQPHGGQMITIRLRWQYVVLVLVLAGVMVVGSGSSAKSAPERPATQA